MDNEERNPVVVLIDEGNFKADFEYECNRLVKDGYEFVSSNAFMRPDCVNPTFTAVLINKSLIPEKKTNGSLQTVASGDRISFEDDCNRLIRKGYKVTSSYCDIDNNDHVFYTAILVKE
jgi:hypothetical protein